MRQREAESPKAISLGKEAPGAFHEIAVWAMRNSEGKEPTHVFLRSSLSVRGSCLVSLALHLLSLQLDWLPLHLGPFTWPSVGEAR